jgi:hypothetical protein
MPVYYKFVITNFSIAYKITICINIYNITTKQKKLYQKKLDSRNISRLGDAYYKSAIRSFMLLKSENDIIVSVFLQKKTLYVN